MNIKINNQPKKNILILGVSGMLGSTLLKYFDKNVTFNVHGTVRSLKSIDFFPTELKNSITSSVDATNFESVINIVKLFQPELIINCIGIVKQIASSNDPLIAIPINSVFPHKLAKLSQEQGAKLIHISTDCVFSGSKGMYVEDDTPDAQDLYGLSKRLGELHSQQSLTIRTSIIGHELARGTSLIDWFLDQKDHVLGFENAIFSGLPTVEIARIIQEYVIPFPNITGLYHLSADSISKYDLLCLVSEIYKKDIQIKRDGSLRIDRSLNSNMFRRKTGFLPLTWPKMIKLMYENR